MTQSPSWYRSRSAVFALIYLTGFLGSFLVAAITHTRYLPAFVEAGLRIGSVAGAAALATLLMLLAFLVRLWGSSYLSSGTVWNADARSQSIVIAGPFRYCRHPLYAGNILLALGMGAVAPVYGWIFIVLANLAFVYALIVHEEHQFAAVHGPAFDSYKKSVPALFPRVPPVAESPGAQPSLQKGLRAECFSGFIILGMAAFFVIPHYGGWVFAACYIAGVIVQRRLES